MASYTQALASNGDSKSWIKQSLIIQEIIPLLRRRGVAIDCGAHWGIWARELSKHFVKVIAVEPVQEHYEVLLDDLPENVEPIRMAISDRDEWVNMRKAGVSSHVMNQEDEKSERILAGILDRWTFLHPNFLKLDLEGYEFRALWGARTMFSDAQKPQVVCIEAKGHHKRYGDPDPRILLEHWGYKLQLKWKPDEVWVL